MLLNSLQAGLFSCFCHLLTLFKIKFFKTFLLGTLWECQTVWIQVGTDILSVLIWVRTVCKSYQQSTKVAPSKEMVNSHAMFIAVFTEHSNYCIQRNLGPSLDLKPYTLLLSADFFFKIIFFKKFFQKHYQSVKQFGFRSGPTFCRSWFESKLFAKVISRRQK